MPDREITLLDDADFSSEAVAALSNEQNARVGSTITETWYEVSTLEGSIGWVNVQPEVVEAFTIQEAQDILSAPEGEEIEVLGSVEFGDLVVSLSSTNIDETIWYNIQTQDGIIGWVQESPQEFTDITIIADESPLISALDDIVVVTILTGGTQVDELDDSELTWYELRLEDGTSGFTNIPPDSISERFATSEEVTVYAAFNDLSTIEGTIPEDTEVDVMSIQDASWYQNSNPRWRKRIRVGESRPI